MKKIVDFIGMTVGGWAGWIVGAWISIFTAFIVSIIGTGLGLYAARRFSKGFLP